MVKKKVDSRIRGLIEYNVRNNHRSFFILVGKNSLFYLFIFFVTNFSLF